MDTRESLPSKGYVRLGTIIGDRRTGAPGVIPVGSSTWWNGVKSGRFPKPVKLGPRITAWRVEDIRQLVEDLGNDK
jgi:prophage regulatory protein